MFWLQRSTMVPPIAEENDNTSYFKTISYTCNCISLLIPLLLLAHSSTVYLSIHTLTCQDILQNDSHYVYNNISAKNVLESSNAAILTTIYFVTIFDFTIADWMKAPWLSLHVLIWRILLFECIILFILLKPVDSHDLTMCLLLSEIAHSSTLLHCIVTPLCPCILQSQGQLVVNMMYNIS